MALLVCLLLVSSAQAAAEQKLVAGDAAVADQFGNAVGISGDVAVVGAHNDNLSHGAAYVFVRIGGVWTEQAKLTASDGANGDQFGISVSIDGDVVVVGAYAKTGGQGAAYVFVKPAGGWLAPTGLTEDAKLLPAGGASVRQFGHSVGVNGDTVVVGAPLDDSARGAAYVFVKPGGGWAGTLNENAKLTALDATAGDQLGFSVGVSGNTVVAGAELDDSGRGSVRVFVKPGGGWSGTPTDDAKLIAGDGTPGDNLGWSLDIDGDTVVAGAYQDDSGRGSAYVFVRPVGGWAGTIANLAKLIASLGTPGDEFAYSVAIDAVTVVAGAPLDDLGGDSLYVYVKPPGGWAGTVSETTKLVSSMGVKGDQLGYSTDFDGDRAIAGAPFNNEARGAAHIFEGQPPTALEVRSVSARRSARGIVVYWRTASEVGVLAFDIYRQAGAGLIRVNRNPVRARRAPAGAAYSILDRRGTVSSSYRLVVVRVDGSRSWSGSVRVR